MQKLIIKGRLPSVNDFIAAAKSHYGAYSKMKKYHTTLVVLSCMVQKIHPMKRIDFVFTHYCKDKRQDKDNISGGAQKIVFDGLQAAGIIKNDGWSEIGSFTHRFFIDKDERIEIELEEAENVEKRI